MIVVLTTTGGRPTPFSLCQRWMERQTYVGPVKWVIVDDCEPATPIVFDKEGWEVVIVRPQPFWQEGENTQARNLKAGLEHVSEDDFLIIIEDDDYYAPTYLETIISALKRYDLVGESEARYFNVETDVYRSCGNTRHASLCSTAMKGDAIKAFRAVLEKAHTFIDKQLWSTFKGTRRLYQWNLTCGIKGLPGRDGIGRGHRMTGTSNKNVLREWIGQDARWYGKG